MTSQYKMHPGNEALEKYSLGHLPEAEVERVEEHLLICESCQDELLNVDAYIRDVKEVCKQFEETPATSREGFFKRWLTAFPMPAMAMSGAVAALALLVAIPFIHQSTGTHGSPVAIELAAMRGGSAAGIATAETGRPLELRIDAALISPAQNYRAEIVNPSGSPVWQGTPATKDGRLIVKVSKPLPAGTYWVRLYGSDPDPVREFGLVVK